jgi:uncharacterized protein
MKQRHHSRTAYQLHLKNPSGRASRIFSFASPSRERGKNRPSRLLFVIVITLAAAFFWTQSSTADEGLLRGPGKTVRARATATGPDRTQGIMEEIAVAPVLFYQHFLSQQWGQSCAYYPPCSNYALLAIRKHGAVIGTIITFDRLQHEANEGRTSPLILLTDGQIKVYDPLENNDYWWYMTSDLEPIAPADKETKTKP